MTDVQQKLLNAYKSTLSTMELEGCQLELQLVVHSARHEPRMRACESSVNQTPACTENIQINVRDGENVVVVNSSHCAEQL